MEPMTTPWRALPIAVASFMLIGGCGDDGDDADVPRQCEDDSDCWSFQACRNQMCECVPSRCDGTCNRSGCVRTACSTSGNRCGIDGYDLCEPASDECYPSNGRCEERFDCPTFDREAVCGADGFCHIAIDRERWWEFEGVPNLALTQPLPGDRFEDAASVSFRWLPRPGPVILVVTSQRPWRKTDLAEPLWAAFAEPETEAVDWSEGSAPDEGGWTAPAAPPSGALYVVATEYQGEQVVRIGDPVAFRVGDDWPALGAPCSEEGETPECDVPDEPRGCYESRCEQACLSHADCRGIADGRCGTPIVGGGRYCGIHSDSRESAAGSSGSGAATGGASGESGADAGGSQG
jgi:hypothetical protein